MTEAETVRARLKALRVNPDKARGQNFLIEPAVIDQIINFGRPKASDMILEIGAGLGALTAELASIAPLAVVEVEEQFAEMIKRDFPDIEVHCDDIRLFDLESHLAERRNKALENTKEKKLTVFGNLPYSLSSEILFYLLDNASYISRAILLLQREFAERVASPEGVKAYGILSVRTQLLADTRLGDILAGDVFYPPASVESRLLELRFLPKPRYEVKDLLTFKSLLAQAFSARRRKLINTLTAAGQYPPEVLLKTLNTLEINPDARAETLTVKQFVDLANSLASFYSNSQK